jgi:hypothetical protein
MSLPALPFMVSLPAPPVSVSAPAPPARVSFPRSPKRLSLPPAPLRVLLPVLPVMMFARPLPVPAMLAAPVRVRFSKLAPRVKVMLLWTVSVPAFAPSVTASPPAFTT